MKMLEELLGLRVIENLTDSPNWESTWWETVFRGLEEDVSAEGAQPTAASGDSILT